MQFSTSNYVGRDANDYIAWANDPHTVAVVPELKDYVLTLVVLMCPGSIVADSDITAYSDKRLKDEIQVIEDPLAKIQELDGVTYDMKDKDGNELGRKTGVIAQDVQKVLPKQSLKMMMDIPSVAYGNMVGLLIAGINEMTNNLGDALKAIFTRRNHCKAKRRYDENASTD